jgi:hypothetical protein
MALGMPETEAELRSAFAVAVPDAAAFLPAASRPGDEGCMSEALHVMPQRERPKSDHRRFTRFICAPPPR